ncbi:MAG: hypothetical protein LLG44_02295 [Chloroflexi bacterium]|nr:hypothetical protein [Chloroflexota bacterium]
MPLNNLVAFTSLPFGIRGGNYELTTPSGQVTIIITDLTFNPFVTLASRPFRAGALPQNGHGEGFISYTWYDHPFVLRVTFGHGLASLGSINSLGTIVQHLPESFDLNDVQATSALREAFTNSSLEAFNQLIAVMRRQARLYHLHDLTRADIQITVRNENGQVVADDPLEGQLAHDEEQPTSSLDLMDRDETWYQDLRQELLTNEPIDLADDLLMEAERALSERFPRQALATCHTVLETAVSSLLTVGMTKRGLPSAAIDDLLLNRSLAAKLDSLLETYTSYSLKRHNRPLWLLFNQLSDLRNDAVHRGHNTTRSEAEFALQVTRDILAWLAFVRSRLKGQNPK